MGSTLIQSPVKPAIVIATSIGVLDPESLPSRSYSPIHSSGPHSAPPEHDRPGHHWILDDNLPELQPIGASIVYDPEEYPRHRHIYSVCAVLYEMLTGRMLVDRATTRTHAIEPGEFAADLGPVADLLCRGTAREPADRLASMADLARSLEILRAGMVRAGQRRQRAWIAGLAAACTAAIAGLLAFALHSPPPPTSASPEAPTVPFGTVAPHAVLTDAPPPATPTTAAREPPGDTPPPATPPVAPREPVLEASLPAMPDLSPDAVAAGNVLDNPKPAVDTSTPPPTVALTEAVVAARLATRGARLRAECDAPWLVLDLTVQRGRATLTIINGMPFTERDPLHACVRAQLRGLDFPRADKPAKFSLPIDLSPKDPR